VIRTVLAVVVLIILEPSCHLDIVMLNLAAGSRWSEVVAWAPVESDIRVAEHRIVSHRDGPDVHGVYGYLGLAAANVRNVRDDPEVGGLG
jgi:hypothetical protein